MKELLHYAKTLAQFSNLTEADADYFRHNYPDFLPEGVWSGAALVPVRGGGSIPPWRVEQEQIIRAWRSGFAPMDCIVSISTVAKMSALEISLQKHLKELDESNELPSSLPDLPEAEAYPIQQAVMFLSSQPWRASVCMRCGNRFVKDRSTRRFCSNKCFRANRRLGKRKWWKDNKGNIKPKRKSKTRKGR